MIGHQIDLVAGDFNGTAWRCSNRDNMSTIDEPFADCALPTPPGLHHCGDPDRFQTTGLTSVGSLNPPDSDRYWKVRMHGAFSIPQQNSRPASNRSKLPSRDMAPLGFRRLAQSHHEEPDRRILLKELPAPHHHGQQKRPCDHSHAFVNPTRKPVHPHEVT